MKETKKIGLIFLIIGIILIATALIIPRFYKMDDKEKNKVFEDAKEQILKADTYQCTVKFDADIDSVSEAQSMNSKLSVLSDLAAMKSIGFFHSNSQSVSTLKNVTTDTESTVKTSSIQYVDEEEGNWYRYYTVKENTEDETTENNTWKKIETTESSAGKTLVESLVDIDNAKEKIQEKKQDLTYIGYVKGSDFAKIAAIMSNMKIDNYFISSDAVMDFKNIKYMVSFDKKSHKISKIVFDLKSSYDGYLKQQSLDNKTNKYVLSFNFTDIGNPISADIPGDLAKLPVTAEESEVPETITNIEDAEMAISEEANTMQ